MAATPYLVKLPSPDAMPSRTLRESVEAMAINAGSPADATAFAKAQFGNDCNAMWDSASVTALSASTDVSGWSFHIQLISPEGVTAVDVTVTATGVGAGLQASGVFTSNANLADGDTITIGTKVYTLQGTLTEADGHVKIGASEAATLANLHHAINKSGGTAGTDYANAVVANTQVTATDDGAHALTLTAIAAGVAGNSIATVYTPISTSHGSFAGATLTGGINASLSGLAALMVTALNATTPIAGAAFNTGTHVLTVAETTDALGDHTLVASILPPGAEAHGVAGLITGTVDEGSASDAVTATLVANTYTIPTIAARLGRVVV